MFYALRRNLQLYLYVNNPTNTLEAAVFWRQYLQNNRHHHANQVWNSTGRIRHGFPHAGCIDAIYGTLNDVPGYKSPLDGERVRCHLPDECQFERLSPLLSEAPEQQAICPRNLRHGYVLAPQPIVA